MAKVKKKKPKAKAKNRAEKKKVKKPAKGNSSKKKAAARKNPAKRKKAGKTSSRKEQAKKPVSVPAPAPVKTKVRESFKKEIMKRLIKAKSDLLAEVAEKVRSESNVHKFEIGDIYDIASNERDRELTLMLGDRDREKLAEIEEALERLENGSYGLCEECGEPIASARLTAMPFTRVCVECKSKDERERGIRRRYDEEPGIAILEKAEAEEEEF